MVTEDIEDICIENGIEYNSPLELDVKSVKITEMKSQNNFDDLSKDSVPSTNIKHGLPGTQKIFIKTWGCSHNNSDSEYMAGLLKAYGYEIVTNGLTADLWLLNSCTVKGPSQSYLLNYVKSAKENGKKIVVIFI